jgi:hypothetical protein
MEPPPFDCEVAGDATADVQGDFLPESTDAACQITAIENVDASTDNITLDCGDVYEISIATSNPHLDLPFSSGDDVLLTASESFESALFGLPSLAIRSPGGELLLGWVNEVDHDPDVDVDPVVFNVAPSGCPTSSGDARCDADGAIAVHRIMLEFGNKESPLIVFDGHQAIVPAGAADMSVIVDRATQILCWDDDCAGDDSGPFDEIRMILVALPSA